MRQLLVLRPEPGASATVERARALGLDAVAAPLFELEPVAWSAPDPADFDGLLLTSANAIRLAGPALDGLRAMPAHAVGKATANAARAVGLTIATTGEGGIEDLLDRLAPRLKLLHLAGEHRRSPAAPRQAITAITVYRSRAIERGIAAAPGTIALVHSPRAGERLAASVAGRDALPLAPHSPAAAAAVGGGWEALALPDRPDDDALLALAARLCNKPSPQ
jgi:uroporphyrinogen-III synthase